MDVKYFTQVEIIQSSGQPRQGYAHCNLEPRLWDLQSITYNDLNQLFTSLYGTHIPQNSTLISWYLGTRTIRFGYKEPTHDE